MPYQKSDQFLSDKKRPSTAVARANTRDAVVAGDAHHFATGTKQLSLNFESKANQTSNHLSRNSSEDDDDDGLEVCAEIQVE